MNHIKLFEKYVDLSTNQSLTETQFNQILEEHCKNFDFSHRPIYRSFNFRGEFYFQNAWSHKKTYLHDDKEYRMSMQSDNNYNYPNTILMNHLPCWQEYPKRQLICSTSKRKFMPLKNYLWRVIPFDNSVWGVVPHFDIHNVELVGELANKLTNLVKDKSNERVGSIKKIMDLKFIGNIRDYSDLLKFCNSVETIDDDKWVFSSNPKKPLGIEWWNKFFSPDMMGFQKMSYSKYINSAGNLPDYTYYDYWNGTSTHYTDSSKIYNRVKADPGHEIWTDCNCLLVYCDD